jgi:uncharacterized protein
MDLSYWLLYIAIGVPVGFLAGLLGIGGGSVIVPILAIVFDRLGFDRSHIMQLAIGTSLACVLTGNSSAARAHQKLGSVDWETMRTMAPAVILGSLAASLIAHWSPTWLLKGVFTAVMSVVLLQMLLEWKPDAHADQLPSDGTLRLAGSIIGILSGLIGIGGAAMSVSFLMWFGVEMRRAIGTASAIGLPIAAAGTLGFMFTGLAETRLPAWSVGYIYLPAWVGISATSILLAPWGARVAHKLPVKVLKRIFIVVLMVLIARMLFIV